MGSPADKIEFLAGKLRELASSLDPDDVVQAAESDVNDSGAMEAIMERRFDTGTSRGWRWAPIKRPKPGSTPLVDTGALKRAAIEAVAGTYRIDHARIRWDVRDVMADHASWHQHGTSTIPSRPFIDPPSEAELLEADDAASAALLEAFETRFDRA